MDMPNFLCGMESSFLHDKFTITVGNRKLMTTSESSAATNQITTNHRLFWHNWTSPPGAIFTNMD